MSLAGSRLSTFGMSTEFNRNILSFIIKVSVRRRCPPPPPPLLTIKRKERYVIVA